MNGGSAHYANKEASESAKLLDKIDRDLNQIDLFEQIALINARTIELHEDEVQSIRAKVKALQASTTSNASELKEAQKTLERLREKLKLSKSKASMEASLNQEIQRRVFEENNQRRQSKLDYYLDSDKMSKRQKSALNREWKKVQRKSEGRMERARKSKGPRRAKR